MFSHSCYPWMFFWFSYILVWKGGSELYVAVKMWALCRFIQWHKDTPLLIILSFLFVFFGFFLPAVQCSTKYFTELSLLTSWSCNGQLWANCLFVNLGLSLLCGLLLSALCFLLSFLCPINISVSSVPSSYSTVSHLGVVFITVCNLVTPAFSTTFPVPWDRLLK